MVDFWKYFSIISEIYELTANLKISNIPALSSRHLFQLTDLATFLAFFDKFSIFVEYFSGSLVIIQIELKELIWCDASEQVRSSESVLRLLYKQENQFLRAEVTFMVLLSPPRGNFCLDEHSTVKYVRESMTSLMRIRLDSPSIIFKILVNYEMKRPGIIIYCRTFQFTGFNILVSV